MKTPIALGLGEILWDVLPGGRKLGGAPANFAYHVNALGGTGIPVSRIGKDDLGREALDILQAKGIATSLIDVDIEHPTGTVNADIDEQGVATYTFPDDVAWDFLEPTEHGMAMAAKADIICFGTLAQRSSCSRNTIAAYLQHAPNTLKIYDINLRQSFYDKERILSSLQMADVLKINDEELTVVASLLSLPEDEETALRSLLSQFDLELAVLTRGENGSLLLTENASSDLPGVATTVVDTVGAGDSFTAALALGWHKGLELDDINRYAATVAAHVCRHAGGMPEMRADMHIDRKSE
ncbi:MAG: carbohydrate kinase [Desulfovibrio sp.]|nr:carbohydrate kinase [Desulfovibrio sp.]|tara:strand:+ start:1587 stop:2477 length:891 start_codon:yes stop_codon:yes gene_type:complete